MRCRMGQHLAITDGMPSVCTLKRPNVLDCVQPETRDLSGHQVRARLRLTARGMQHHDDDGSLDSSVCFSITTDLMEIISMMITTMTECLISHEESLLPCCDYYDQCRKDCPSTHLLHDILAAKKRRMLSWSNCPNHICKDYLSAYLLHDVLAVAKRRELSLVHKLPIANDLNQSPCLHRS